MKTETKTRKVAMSLTSTIIAFIRGHLTEEDMVNFDHFYFSCSPEHIFGVEGCVPSEATWANAGERVSLYEADGNTPKYKYLMVPMELIDECNRAKCNRFMQLMTELRNTGKMTFLEWGKHVADIEPADTIAVQGHRQFVIGERWPRH
jgi:hypothetical protein